MLEIERLSWRSPRYAVRDDRGHEGVWVRRRFKERMSGEIDGERYEFGRDGRRRFVLTRAGSEVAAAEAGRRGRWSITAGDSMYELRRKSPLRSEVQLWADQTQVGSIRKASAPRGKIVCDLPAEFSPTVQTFIGFVVVALWSRAAAGSVAVGAGVATSQGG